MVRLRERKTFSQSLLIPDLLLLGCHCHCTTIGDCDNDSDCQGDLICFHRNATEPVPGCAGNGPSDWDYCISRPSTSLISPSIDFCTPSYPCARCYGTSKEYHFSKAYTVLADPCSTSLAIVQNQVIAIVTLIARETSFAFIVGRGQCQTLQLYRAVRESVLPDGTTASLRLPHL